MGKLSDDFRAEAKKINSNLSRWTKSSLEPVIAVLAKVPDASFGQAYQLRPDQERSLAQAINALKPGKAKRYAKALTWLESRIPTLRSALAGRAVPTGQTTGGYSPGKEVRRKDKDNRWHKFYLQSKGNSCGPTCARTILLAHTLRDMPSERTIRDMVGLVEHGLAHTGTQVSGHDWETTGSNVPGLVQVLKSYGVRNARAVTGRAKVREALLKCSVNEPGILGWWWGPSWGHYTTPPSGHWTVCAGPTKDKSQLVILDPWNEVQYVDVASFSRYLVSDGSFGWFNPDDPDPAVIATYE